MRWPCIAIGTAMLATAIGIDACHHRQIGAFVIADDGFRLVGNKLRLDNWQIEISFRSFPSVIESLSASRLEAVMQI